MAPEVANYEPHGLAVDEWALGILVFELLNGEPPFTDPNGNDMQTYQNITHGALSKCYPESSSPLGSDLANSLYSRISQ